MHWTFHPRGQEPLGTTLAELHRSVTYTLTNQRSAIQAEQSRRHEPDIGPTYWPDLYPMVSRDTVTVATDGSVLEQTHAGGAYVIYNGGPERWAQQTPALQLDTFRVYGTPSSNRAELFAVLRALRTCKEVKTLHIQCDSETTHKMILKSLEGKILKHHTPNRDLIERCAQEIKWRTENSKETTWHDVKAHSDEEPWQHKAADFWADKAARLELPPHNQHLRRLEPAWALVYQGAPRQNDGLKTTLCALEDEAAMAGAGMAPHLQLTLLSSKLHPAWSRAIADSKNLTPKNQELLLRLKFGATRGTPERCVPALQPGQFAKCPHCHQCIKHTNLDGKIHGTAWTDHALHYCTHGPFVAARQAVQDALSAKMVECAFGDANYAPDVKVHLRSLTEDPSAPKLPDDHNMVLDLRGFVPTDIEARTKHIMLTRDDVVSMFNSSTTQLQEFSRLIDAKTPCAVLATALDVTSGP